MDCESKIRRKGNTHVREFPRIFVSWLNESYACKETLSGKR